MASNGSMPVPLELHLSDQNRALLRAILACPKKQTPEERRERNRQNVQRCYYRRLETLEVLRTQVNELESKFADLLHTQQQQQQQQQQQSALTPGRHSVSPQQFQQLLRLRRQLCRENQALREQTMEHLKFQNRLAGILATEDLNDSPRQQNEPRDRLRQEFTADECRRIALRAYDEIVVLTSSRDTWTTGTCMLGWRDQNRLENGVLTFSLSKTFAGCTTDDLSMRSWAFLTTPTEMLRLYTTTLDFRIQPMQCVDDNSFVFYRTITPASAKNVTFAMLFLLVRLRVDHGWLFIFRTLDEDRMEFAPMSMDVMNGSTNPRQRQRVWWGMLTWVFLRDVETATGPGVEMMYGGSVPVGKAEAGKERRSSAMQADTGFWIVETLLVILRWENITLGPRSILNFKEQQYAEQQQ